MLDFLGGVAGNFLGGILTAAAIAGVVGVWRRRRRPPAPPPPRRPEPRIRILSVDDEDDDQGPCASPDEASGRGCSEVRNFDPRPFRR